VQDKTWFLFTYSEQAISNTNRFIVGKFQNNGSIQIKFEKVTKMWRELWSIINSDENKA